MDFKLETPFDQGSYTSSVYRHFYLYLCMCVCVCVCVLRHSVMSNSLQPHGLQLARLLYPWNSPGKNAGMSSRSLLQGIFPTQGSNPGIFPTQRSNLHWRQSLYCLSDRGSPQFCVQMKEPFGPRKENKSLKGPLLNHLTSEKTKHIFSSILMLQASCIYLGFITPCPETYPSFHPPRRLITP